MLNFERDVVITGLGVVAPNGVGVPAFEAAIRTGKTGLTTQPKLRDLKFGCHVAGVPEVTNARLGHYLTALERKRLTSKGLIYGLLAGLEAFEDSRLSAGHKTLQRNPRWGCVFGAGVPGIDVLGPGIAKIDAGEVRRLGSAMIELQMPSTCAAYLAAKLRFGGHVACNSLACATGTESVLMGAERIATGQADVVLVGSCESGGEHLWGSFDTLRVLPRQFNSNPRAASRPLSSTAAGFVPAAGAGALVLESKEHAVARGATVYAEIAGGHVNCGAQEGDGSMTLPNPVAVVECIRESLNHARLEPPQVDAISGHLTATRGDPTEVECLSRALERRGSAFPRINSLKSMIGHTLSASGAIELVAGALQLSRGFLHPSTNCEDPHPELKPWLDPGRIVQEATEDSNLHTLLKCSFGFGDLNACAVLRRANHTAKVR